MHAECLSIHALGILEKKPDRAPVYTEQINRHQASSAPPYPFLNSVRLLSRVRLFVIPWTAACQASLSITNSWSLLKLMSVEW